MTILFAGGEDTSFVLSVGNVNIDTNPNYYRTGFARVAVGQVETGGGGVTNWPMDTIIATPALGPQTNFWAHGRLYTAHIAAAGATNATTASAIMLGVADVSGVGRILISGTGVAGQLKISKRNAAGVITDIATSVAGAFPTCAVGVPVPVDVFINYSVLGQCTLYANGNVVVDTGANVDIITDGVTSLQSVYYGSFLSAAFGSTWAMWSECVVATTSTIGVCLWTLAPAAAGNTQSWTPNTLANINKTTINDSTSIATTSDNALTEWTTNVIPPSGIWSVAAIVQESRVNVGATGPQHFAWTLRTKDGTDHSQGSVAPTSVFANYGSVNGGIWPLNPLTSAAWNITDIAIGFNAGIESLA
jgi:hypothetical protein